MTKDWKYRQFKRTEKHLSWEKTVLLSVLVLSCVTLVEKNHALVMPESGLCTLAVLAHTHTVYVLLNFQNSLGKLTPVANSFSPLLYYTYLRGTTGPSVVYGNAC